MPNTFFGLNIGYTGIQAANVNLNVTANNIANEHTEGYSRQVARQTAMSPLQVYQKYGMIGTGVQVTDIDRIRNEYYDVKYQENQTRYGENNTKYYHMLKIEDVFNESKIDGFTEEYDNLYNKAIEELMKDPSDNSTRNNYLNYLESFIEYVQEIKTDLRLQQEDLNAEIADYVENINSLSSEIAIINKQINVIELTGASANELRDQRSVLIDKLSEVVSVSTNEIKYANGKSEFFITLGGAPLVSNYESYQLKVEARKEAADPDDVVGLYNVKWAHGTDFNPVKENVNGALRALFEVRDGNNGDVETDANGNQFSINSYEVEYKGVPYYIEQLDKFLDQFTSTINGVHAAGQDAYGKTAADYGADYEPIIVKSENGVYSVNTAVKNDLNLIATAYNTSDGASQNDLLYKLQHTKNEDLYNGGTASEYLQSTITEIAVDTRKTKSLSENYKNMQNTIENQRLSIMGVDKDEEAMNLVKFQEAYNLNSKVISIMAEVYDRLILQTGV